MFMGAVCGTDVGLLPTYEHRACILCNARGVSSNMLNRERNAGSAVWWEAKARTIRVVIDHNFMHFDALWHGIPVLWQLCRDHR